MTTTPKIVSCCTLFIVTFFFGVLPCGIVRLLKRRTPNSSVHQKYISWMNCFAGGVFFGTTFIHLIPESREELLKVLDIDFPIAEILMSGGFFVVLLLEHLFGLCFVCCRSLSVADKRQLMNGNSIKENEYEIPDLRRKSQKTVSPERNVEQLNTNALEGETNPSYTSNNNISGQDTNPSLPVNGVTRKSSLTIQTEPEIETTVDDGRVSSVRSRVYSDHLYEDIDGTINDSEEENISVFRATVLIIALSLHMIFEGLALGLQDKVPAVWTLLIVISVHKCLVAVSVGLKLNDVMRKLTHITFCVFLFALVTPLGIIIGILINNLTATENTVSGILECIAAGSFLYVTFFEILQREFNDHHNMIKVLLTFIGFCVSAGAKFLQVYFQG